MALQKGGLPVRARHVVPLQMAFLLLLITTTIHAQDTIESPNWPDQFYAPYIYAGSLPLAYMEEQTGVRYYTLAFMLSKTDECQAAWQGGMSITSERLIARELEKLRAKGGDVIVSFGGWAGEELARICTDVESLTAQYQSVIDAYGLTWLDFDIEGGEIHEGDSVARRSEAIAALQAQAAEEGRALHVTFTLPVLPTGLTEEGIAVLQSAIDYGVEIDLVNIMTMNYGSDYPADEMGALSIQAAESLFEQLGTLYPDKTEAERWRMIGLTPMIGLNDTMPQTFTLDDAALLTAFAQEKGIRMIAMWSFNRDKACGGNAAVLTDACSGIAQEDYAFSAVFNQVADVG
jgi:chitinase